MGGVVLRAVRVFFHPGERRDWLPIGAGGWNQGGLWPPMVRGTRSGRGPRSVAPVSGCLLSGGLAERLVAPPTWRPAHLAPASVTRNTGRFAIGRSHREKSPGPCFRVPLPNGRPREPIGFSSGKSDRTRTWKAFLLEIGRSARSDKWVDRRVGERLPDCRGLESAGVVRCEPRRRAHRHNRREGLAAQDGVDQRWRFIEVALGWHPGRCRVTGDRESGIDRHGLYEREADHRQQGGDGSPISDERSIHGSSPTTAGANDAPIPGSKGCGFPAHSRGSALHLCKIEHRRDGRGREPLSGWHLRGIWDTFLSSCWVGPTTVRLRK